MKKGAPVRSCVGFIDGTFNRIARPRENQEVVYNGHYRGHGLKYQAIVTPDGITSSIIGPETGNHHDMHMYRLADTERRLFDAFDFTSVGRPCYHLYGDSAYANSAVMARPFRITNASEDDTVFNTEMSRVRISVEQEFAHVGSFFAFLKYSQTQRIDQCSVGLYYIIGTFLKNVHICYNGGNKTSAKFDVSPPTPEQYIAGLLRQ
ncbi:hypothetical protein PHYBLDRAFT_165708 [Phycomyces blakesleeanus NRRL 1555(-)]|uniref:DDE Tnp4 domain-containing protein n=1 Tax=Phycomyces blakesleeanus (strain ATCC 8743b / DSM 1359 / FGSC 10004 / NBRC 33097 / NRRL 1555) TaxID=763407 RepID=A0A163E7Y5_PHYB8|nr:hypothetical protein PHYBLDRAFT_165708 [Phycomyces blakesleeanus NRRL 1555(-)]OAD77220.1 hypothetical protein PHYBLDRAFT_165708 [Phycomyces blakesleeanus NRRL 1555(-)]|eukprot:XP_018295260.1 hypothetical protein PHYBLDRAFT_165708 [Phycomyces blakesleeanus NRRL 1555(-)]